MVKEHDIPKFGGIIGPSSYYKQVPWFKKRKHAVPLEMEEGKFFMAFVI